jgi:hypothetical protein
MSPTLTTDIPTCQVDSLLAQHDCPSVSELRRKGVNPEIMAEAIRRGVPSSAVVSAVQQFHALWTPGDKALPAAFNRYILERTLECVSARDEQFLEIVSSILEAARQSLSDPDSMPSATMMRRAGISLTLLARALTGGFQLTRHLLTRLNAIVDGREPGPNLLNWQLGLHVSDYRRDLH